MCVIGVIHDFLSYLRCRETSVDVDNVLVKLRTCMHAPGLTTLKRATSNGYIELAYMQHFQPHYHPR